MASQSSSGHVYTIGGVRVEFPMKAYPSQIAMMNKVIQSLQRGQNSLLESPTGSGKSLALLCSTLAWQRAELERRLAFEGTGDDYAIKSTNTNAAGTSLLNESTTVNCRVSEDSKVSIYLNKSVSELGNGSDVSSLKVTKPSTASPIASLKKGVAFDPDDDDFQAAPPWKRERGKEKRKRKLSSVSKSSSDECTSPRATSTGTVTKLTTPGPSTSISSAQSAPALSTNNLQQQNKTNVDQILQENAGGPRGVRVPRIYFGTRTHKQIAQIVRELKKTCYRNTRMAILSSRDHSCINEQVARKPNLKEACKELLDYKYGIGCMYHQKVRQYANFETLADYGYAEAYDLEEFVKWGHKVRCCPYYGSRQLKDSAQIIFCPYNYLIDPQIRSSMRINLDGQIVVLDEAHNIEDSARESASYSVTLDELQDGLRNCEEMMGLHVLPEAHAQMAQLFSIVSTMIEKENNHLTTQIDYNQQGKVWSGKEFMAKLATYGVNLKLFTELQGTMALLVAAESEDFEDKRQRTMFQDGGDKDIPTLRSKTLALLQGLFMALQFMFTVTYVDDYKVALIKTVNNKSRRDSYVPGRWNNTRDTPQQGWTYTINFWCLNPAVALSTIRGSVHSIILTSGTLSPMNTFQSELDVPFPLQLEANHVISPTQVWAGTLSCGPSLHRLNATYKHTSSFDFQDELGKLVREVCATMPRGVLCFLPSYKLMETLAERWESTGLWNQLEQFKYIVTEPRVSYEFDEAMQSFYDALERTGSDEYAGSQTGALFLAVCRGKVSEGMDFADDNARAVICVGIPFPNFKDYQIGLKREYNDTHHRTRGLLSGKDWYDIQAFRALNQALGRCIRHADDWGALILVDERFSQNQRYTLSLSKWVRNMIRHHLEWNNMLESLQSFRDVMIRRDKEIQRIKEEKVSQESERIKQELETLKLEAADSSENYEIITIDSPPSSNVSSGSNPLIQSIKQQFSEKMRKIFTFSNLPYVKTEVLESDTIPNIDIMPIIVNPECDTALIDSKQFFILPQINTVPMDINQ